MIQPNWSYNYSNGNVVKTKPENWFGLSYYVGRTSDAFNIKYKSNLNFDISVQIKTHDSSYYNIGNFKIVAGNQVLTITIPDLYKNEFIDSIIFSGPILNQHFTLCISDPPKKQKINIEGLINNLIDCNTQYKFEHIEPYKFLHILCPALNPDNKNLYDRELLAIKSILSQSNEKLSATRIILSVNDPKIEGFEFIQAKYPSDPSKSFILLSEVLDQEYSHILYTNSDCQLVEGFYDRLYDLIDSPAVYYRLNQTKNKNKIFDNGIDGVFFSKKFYNDNLKKLPLDFYLGRPHWDTCLGNYLLENKLVRSDCKSLIHPVHNIAWSNSNYNKLSKEEQHNSDLWSTYLNTGLMNHHMLEFNPLKLSVVIVFFGTDQTRIDNAKIVLNSLRKQSIDYELIFVEGYYESQRFSYLAGIENNIYIPLKMNENNQGLWQKECQMNIGAKAATCECVLFIDADLCCDDNRWLEKVVEAQDGKTVLQPWMTVEDNTSGQKYVSQIAKKYCGVESDEDHNPGMCFCVSRSMLETNDYLNPYYIYGGGDSGFMYEYCEEETYMHLVKNYKQIARIFRDSTTKYKSNYLNVNLKHLYHGNVDNSYFENRHKGLGELDICDNVEIENGLLKWKGNSDIARMIINKIISSKKKISKV